MTPDQVRSAYRRGLSQVGLPTEVIVRRYTGSGINQPRYDATAMGRAVGFNPEDLVGGIVQGDSKVIVFYQDLVDAQFPLPLRAGANEKLVIRGKELTIKSVDDKTRRVQGELIAYEIVVTG